MTNFWVFTILFSILFYIYTKRVDNKFDPRRLIFWVFLVFIVMPAVLILPLPVSNYVNLDNPERTIAQVGVFFLVFLVVSEFLAPIPRFQSRYLSINLTSRVYAISIICLAVTAIAKVYLYKRGLFFIQDESDRSLVRVPAYIEYFKNIYLFGLAYIATYSFRKWQSMNFLQKSYLVVYILLVLGTEFMQGRRTGAVLPFAMIFTIWAVEHRIKVLNLFFIGLGGLLVFLSTTIYRINQVLFISDSFDAGTASDLFSGDVMVYLDAFSATIVNRVGNPLIMVDKLVTAAPTLGDPPFSSFLLSIEGIIPRMFYPSKPALSIGNEYGRFLGEIHHSNYEVGINPGWIAEGFFYNYSLLGVVFSAILFAVCSNLAYKLCDLKTDMGKVLIWQLIIFLFSGFQLEIAFTVNTLIKGVILNVILFVVMSAGSKNKSSV